MRMNKILKLSVVSTIALPLLACGYEGADIQQQYVGDHDECRAYAEEITASSTANSRPSGQEHILLVAHFARCMNKRGWDVNKPPADVAAEAMKSVSVPVRGR